MNTFRLTIASGLNRISQGLDRFADRLEARQHGGAQTTNSSSGSSQGASNRVASSSFQQQAAVSRGRSYMPIPEVGLRERIIITESDGSRYQLSMRSNPILEDALGLTQIFVNSIRGHFPVLEKGLFNCLLEVNTGNYQKARERFERHGNQLCKILKNYEKCTDRESVTKANNLAILIFACYAKAGFRNNKIEDFLDGATIENLSINDLTALQNLYFPKFSVQVHSG